MAAIGLCKAALSYDTQSSQFSTYAFNCMFNCVFAEKRKELSMKTIPENQIVYYNSKIKDDNGSECIFLNLFPGNENVESEVLAEIIFEEYCKNLSCEHKEILRLLKNGYKRCEIAYYIGCSTQLVSKVVSKFKNWLYEERRNNV